jgi:hypothetical protein
MVLAPITIETTNYINATELFTERKILLPTSCLSEATQTGTILCASI